MICVSVRRKVFKNQIINLFASAVCSVNGQHSSDETGESALRYKSFFLQAMMFYSKAEGDKKVCNLDLFKILISIKLVWMFMISSYVQNWIIHAILNFNSYRLWFNSSSGIQIDNLT